MGYRINPLDDPEPHFWCCEVLFLDDDTACTHLWLVHGERRVQAEITLVRAKGQPAPVGTQDRSRAGDWSSHAAPHAAGSHRGGPANRGCPPNEAHVGVGEQGDVAT